MMKKPNRTGAILEKEAEVASAGWVAGVWLSMGFRLRFKVKVKDKIKV